MANARSAWGIDIGNRALKAVRVVREGDGVRIADCEVIEHENILTNAGDNRESLVQAALSNFAHSRNIKGEDVAIGVSGQSSFARFIKLPPVEPKQIPSIVRFEAIQQIPFPLEDVEWSYQLFRDDASPDVEVGIFAMRKELVQEHIKFFSDAGLNVQVVQMNPLAVYNGLYYDERLKDGTTMVIDLGAENTDLIIAEGETIWLRSIPIGGNNFTEALVKSFKLRFEKAEDLKRNAATSKYGRQILQAMRPIFADLVAEIQRSIGFYASVHRDSRITKVLALGGTFRLPGLQKYLQQNLQLEVQKIDRLGNVATADSKVAASLSENLLSAVGAYGLALQVVGDGKITSSLLPHAIRREREWRSKTKWFAAAAACVVAGTGIALGRYYIEQAQYKSSTVEENKRFVDDALAHATQVSNDWKSHEAGGAKEIADIANLNSLGDYRALWENIYNDITQSVPLPPPTQQDVSKMPPRNSRPEIIIDDITSDYKSDLSTILPLDNAGVLAAAGVATPGGGGAGNLNYGHGAAGPGFMPAPATPAASTDSTTPGPRGFLITIHCRTPYKNGIKLVNDTLFARLLQKKADTAAQIANGTLPKPQYTFEKVWIPKYVQLRDEKDRVQELKQRARETADRRRQASPGAAPGIGMPIPGAVAPHGVVPGVHRMQPFAPAPAPMPAPMPAPSGRPGVEGGTVGPDGMPEDADPVDPLTKESIMDDWDVIVFAAVVLDPGPASATPPADQGSTPGNPVPSPGPAMPAPAMPAPAMPAPGHHAIQGQAPAPMQPLASR